jgi:hypothetical protein
MALSSLTWLILSKVRATIPLDLPLLIFCTHLQVPVFASDARKRIAANAALVSAAFVEIAISCPTFLAPIAVHAVGTPRTAAGNRCNSKHRRSPARSSMSPLVEREMWLTLPEAI